MPSTTQLPLPWDTQPQLSRADFIAAPGNQAALAFIDRWPHWPGSVAALHGPPASGKSHLAAIWIEYAEAIALEVKDLSPDAILNLEDGSAVVVENIDSWLPSLERDRALMALLDRAHGFFVLTGRAAPKNWPVMLPDLASRFAALPDLALGAPDEALLRILAAKLFADRQLTVPEAVITQMLNALERSPSAIRDFVARADAYALSLHRKISTQLISGMLGKSGPS